MNQTHSRKFVIFRKDDITIQLTIYSLSDYEEMLFEYRDTFILDCKNNRWINTDKFGYAKEEDIPSEIKTKALLYIGNMNRV